MHQHVAGAKKILGNQDIGISRGGNIHDNELAIILLEKMLLPAFPTSQMRFIITTSTLNFTRQETLSNDFFNVSKTSDILLLVMINCSVIF